MKKLFNKYDLIWFITLFLVILITLILMIILHSSYKLISHVFFGMTIVGACGLLFLWIARKKDNHTYKKGKEKFTDTDKRIIQYYIDDNKYNNETFRLARTKQTFRFLTIIILPTIVTFIISIIYAFI